MYLAVSPYKEVLDGIVAALSANESLITLTGPTDSGKTALCNQLAKRLERNGMRVVHYLNPPANVEALQAGILQQLGLDSTADFMGSLIQHLTSLPAVQGSLVLLVDDAHELDLATFNAVCALSDIQDDRYSLIMVIICGHDILNQKLQQPEYQALAPHAASFQLTPLSLDQLRNFHWQYWRHHDQEVAIPSVQQLKVLLKNSGGLPGAVMQQLGTQEPISIFHARSAGLPEEKVLNPGQRQMPATSAAVSSRSRNLFVVSIVMALVAVGGYVAYNLVGPELPPEIAVVLQPSQPEPPVTATAPASVASESVITESPEVAAAEAEPRPLPDAGNIETTTDSEPATEQAVEPPLEQTAIVEPTPAAAISQAEIEMLLNSWTTAWQQQDLSGYFAAYDPAFEPANGESHDAWQAQRQRAISNAREISLRWYDLVLVSQEADTALVEVWLGYDSATYKDSTLKQLRVQRNNGALHITAENNLRVDRR